MKKRILLFILTISVLLSNIGYCDSPIEEADNNLATIANIEKKKVEESTSENTSEENIPVTNESVENNEPIIEKPKTVNFVEQISNSNDLLGTFGRIYLPSINLNVAVYYANLEIGAGYNAQTIVDKEDSAAYFNLGEKSIIADHNYQGFNKLFSLNINDVAYIKNVDGTIATYKLTSKFIGKNIVDDLIDLDGNSVKDKEGNLIMYTCYQSDYDVMITLWTRI